MEKRKWEKSVPFQKLSGKKFCEKQTNKQKSPPDFIGKKVPVGAVHRKQFFYLRVAAVSNQLFQGNWITVNCDHQKGFQFIHIVKDVTPSHL